MLDARTSPARKLISPRAARTALVTTGICAVAVAAATVGVSAFHSTSTIESTPPSVTQWVTHGGRDVVAEVRFRAYALSFVRNNIEAPFACSKLAEATQSAVNYGPIPDARTQALWSSTLTTAQNAVTSCSTSIDADRAAVRGPVASDAREVVVDARRVAQRLHQQLVGES